MAISELLKILIFAGFNFLPKDSRTMMKTPKNLDIKTLAHGRMWYHGLKICLENVYICPLSKHFNVDIKLEFRWSTCVQVVRFAVLAYFGIS